MVARLSTTYTSTFWEAVISPGLQASFPPNLITKIKGAQIAGAFAFNQYMLLHRLRHVIFFLFHPVPAQQVRQALREG